MKIGFVGTKVRVDLVRNVVSSHFPEIDAEYFIDEDYHFSEHTSEYLSQLARRADGIIFGGAVQYGIYKSMLTSVPCLHIQKDSSSLLNSLMALAYMKRDITRISVDNYPMTMIKQVLADCRAQDADFIPLRSRVFHGYEPHGYEELYLEHKALYESGKVDGCVTTMSFVFSALQKDGIPAVYSAPTTENIIKTIYQIKAEISAQAHEAAEELAVLILRVVPNGQLSYQRRKTYLEAEEKIKAATEINYFAKDWDALVIPRSDEQFIILLKKRDLMNYTNDLQSFPLLNLINDNTKCGFCLGVGFSKDLAEAYSNAAAAVRRAETHADNCAYAAYDTNSVIGPIDFIGWRKNELSFEQEKLKNLSEQTGVSGEKLFQIYTMAEKKQKHLFSAEELAKNLEISVRTASRLLLTLEEHGVAKLSYKAPSGKAGRPKHIYELLFRI